MSFDVLETTIADVHAAYRSGQLTCRQLVQSYLDRIENYDRQGPAINAIITINPAALKEADRLDAAFKAGAFVGPLHGVPIIMKDQGDAVGMPTTLGSVLFKDYYPDRDAFVVGDDTLHAHLVIGMVGELRLPGLAHELQVAEAIAGGIDELIIVGHQIDDPLHIV